MINKITIAITSILLLAIPSSAFAVIGTGIFDAFKKAMGGIEEKIAPISDWMIDILFIYGIALLLLALFTWLFQRVIEWNLEHLTIVDNPGTDVVEGAMVAIGFDFLSGIANMALILIFIYLAFAIILKIESVGAKKILPRLIIVALLLNFSLVFIGMAIDIINIFYNTLLPDEAFIWKLIEPFIATGVTAIVTLVASITALGSAFAKPIVGLAAQTGFLIGFPLITLPSILVLVAQIFIFAILILTFLLFILVFGARVITIQMLAVLSPLAFLCLIFPQTIKYFDMWLKHFIGWLITGVFLLFFLRLGFLLFEVFRDDLGIVGETLAAVFPVFDIGGWFSFYFFVVVYLLTLLAIAKKTMPEAAMATVSTVEGFIKRATIGWGTKAGGEMLKKLRSDESISAVSHQISDLGTKMAKKGGITGALGRWAVRRSEEVGLSAEKRMKKEDDEKSKDIEVMDDQELKKAAMTSNDTATRIKALIKLQEKEKIQGMLDNGDITEEEIAHLHKIAIERSTGIHKDLEEAFPEMAKDFVANKRSKRQKETEDNVSQTREDKAYRKIDEEISQNEEKISATENEREQADKDAEQWIKRKIEDDEKQGKAIDENYFKTLCEDYSKQAQTALDNGNQREALKYNSMAQVAWQKIVEATGATRTIEEAKKVADRGEDPNKVIDKEKTKRFKQAKKAEKTGNNQEAAQHMLAIREMEKYQADKIQTRVAKAIAKDPSKINNMDLSKALADPNMRKKLMEYCSPSILRKMSEADLKATEKLVEAFEKKLNILDTDDERTVEIKIKAFQKSFPSMARYLQTTAAAEFGFKDIFAKGRRIQAAAQQTAARQEPSKRPANVPYTATWNAKEQMWEKAGKFWDREGKKYRKRI